MTQLNYYIVEASQLSHYLHHKGASSNYKEVLRIIGISCLNANNSWTWIMNPGKLFLLFRFFKQIASKSKPKNLFAFRHEIPRR